VGVADGVAVAVEVGVGPSVAAGVGVFGPAVGVGEGVGDGVGVGVAGAITSIHSENSDISSASWLSAIAVMKLPAATGVNSGITNSTSPWASVFAVVPLPMYSWPSPLPLGSQSSLAKN
jgi:hypothetical protein